MVKINHYEFGKVIVDKKVYSWDIKIVKGEVVPNWYRKEGHKLYLEDIKDILDVSPKTIIVGTGANSVMEVLDEVKDYCKNKNINLYILNSYEAVNLFNKAVEENKETIALCLHLTC